MSATCLLVGWGASAQAQWEPLPPPVQPPDPPQLAVEAIEVLGSTAFPPERLAAITAPYVGRTVSLEELAAAANEILAAINQLYESEGYLASGAYLPRQDLSQGRVRIQVVEGELEAVEVAGLERLNPSYVRERLVLAGFAPLRVSRLSAAIGRLQESPLIESIRAELRYTAASGGGWGILTLYPFVDGAAIGSNFLPPSSPDSAASVGVGLDWNWKDLLQVRLDYAIPLVPFEGDQDLLFSVQLMRRF